MSLLNNIAYQIWVKDFTKEGLLINFEYHFHQLLLKIDSGEPFTFVRISDGEYNLLVFNKSWDGLLDHKTITKSTNCLDSFIQKKKAGKENLILAFQNGTNYDHKYLTLIKTLEPLRRNAPPTPMLSWATVTGRMLDLFKCLRDNNRPIILVGSYPLQKIKAFVVSSFVEMPAQRSWHWQDYLEYLLFLEIERYKDENPIIIYCCAISAKLMIHKNYEVYGHKITQLDLGANLSPYVGVSLRDWHGAVYERFKETHPQYIP